VVAHEGQDPLHVWQITRVVSRGVVADKASRGHLVLDPELAERGVGARDTGGHHEGAYGATAFDQRHPLASDVDVDRLVRSGPKSVSLAIFQIGTGRRARAVRTAPDAQHLAHVVGERDARYETEPGVVQPLEVAIPRWIEGHRG